MPRSLRLTMRHFTAGLARRSHRRMPAWITVSFILAFAMSGCGDDPVAPQPVVDATRLYWALELSHHTAVLSTETPYDTISLTATPRAPNGERLDGLPAPTFVATDPERVEVSPDGLVRALKTGTNIKVVARLSYDNVTHADTLVLRITALADPPQLATFSIQPAPGDSAKVAMLLTKSLRAQATDTTGSAMAGLAIYYASSDPAIAKIDRSNGRVTPVRPGRVTLTAATHAYGVTRSDTLQFTIGWPISQTVFALEAGPDILSTSPPIVGSYVFAPRKIVIGTGGTVSWIATTPIDVTFEDPTNVEGGDIDEVTPGFFTPGLRRFPVPGTYPYRSTRYGSTGTVVVVDESVPQP